MWGEIAYFAERALRKHERIAQQEQWRLAQFLAAMEASPNGFLLLGAVLFCIGVYGVIVRKNAVLVLMSIELILNSVNINLLAFDRLWADGNGGLGNHDGNVFALYIIAIAAAEGALAAELAGFRERDARADARGAEAAAEARRAR